MNQEQRINYIVQLYDELEPEKHHDRYTLFKNATIEAICFYNGGAYNRVKSWLESKIGEKIGKIEKERQDTNKDMELAGLEFKKCFELMLSRNKNYGSSWKKLRVEGIVDLMAMKLDRCQKQKLEKKALEVEAEDIINYGILLLTKLRNNL